MQSKVAQWLWPCSHRCIVGTVQTQNLKNFSHVEGQLYCRTRLSIVVHQNEDGGQSLIEYLKETRCMFVAVAPWPSLNMVNWSLYSPSPLQCLFTFFFILVLILKIPFPQTSLQTDTHTCVRAHTHKRVSCTLFFQISTLWCLDWKIIQCMSSGQKRMPNGVMKFSLKHLKVFGFGKHLTWKTRIPTRFSFFANKVAVRLP